MVNKNVQLQLDVTKSRSIKLYTFGTIFIAHNFRAKSNSKNVHFQWKRMNLTNLISDKKYDFYVKL